MLVVMVLVLVAIYVYRVSHLPRSNDISLLPGKSCLTQGCVSHMRFLTDGLNRSLDPCHDFAAYVCSAWRAGSSPNPAIKRSQVGDVVRTWLGGLRDLLSVGPRELEVARKPLALFRSCLARRPASADDLADFRSFLSSLGLCWPDEDCPHADALGTLLALVYRWDVCFWMRIRVLHNFKHGDDGRRLALYTGPGLLVRQFVARHDRLNKSEEYLNHWTRHRDALLGRAPYASEAVAAATREKIERVMRGEEIIARALLETVNILNWDPKEILFADIQRHTANVSARRWLDNVNAHIAVASNALPFTEKHRLMVENRPVIEFVGKIFGLFSDREIVAHLSWQFVQVYGVVVDARLGDAFEQNGGELFCERQVVAAYAPLVATLQSKLRMPLADRASIENKLFGLVDRAAQMISTLAWLDIEARRVAVTKLRSLSTRLGPSEQLERLIKNIYSVFPNTTGQSFVKGWLRTRAALAAPTSMRYRNIAAGYEPLLSPYIITYDYLANAIDFSDPSLGMPFYYTDGTLAMFYGGIGFYFTAELLRLMDSCGLKIDPEGHVILPSWMSEGSRQNMFRKLSCSGAGASNVSPLLPYLPALEVTTRVFVQDVISSGVSLELNAELNEQKVLFMTLCRLACADPPLGIQALDCNAILKNTRAFAEAYGCGKDSPMNPSKKCGYFE
ncbi:endothelin-converting enzyme 1-like [Haemaphysalis longicornis]